MVNEHPLSIEKPDTWNNIPICLTVAISSILSHIIDSDAELFEYQMKTNDRIWKLQDQVSRHKKRNDADRERFAKEIEARMQAQQESTGVKFADMEREVKTSNTSSD